MPRKRISHGLNEMLRRTARLRALRIIALIVLLGALNLWSPGPGRTQTGTMLVPGWNNVLYLGPTGPIGEELAVIADALRGALYWDAGQQRWQVYVPGTPQSGDLVELRTGQVYWFAIADPVLLPQGIEAAHPSQLVAGWNNVPYLGPGAPTSALLESSMLWSWDAAAQRWLYRDPAAPEGSDFNALTPLHAYWLFVAGGVPATPTTAPPAVPSTPPATPTALGAGCYPFQSLQPSLQAADDTLTAAGLGTLGAGDAFTPPPLRSGVDGGGPALPFYIPPTLMRAIAWVESGWHQASYSTARGQSGPTLSSPTCAYGLMQLLTGMQVNGSPTPRQASIGGDYKANAGAGAQILAADWNRDSSLLPVAGRHDPHILEDWYFAIWAYHCFGPVCLDYGAHNNPDDPALPWPRPAYNSPDQLLAGTNLGYSDYPYQELVFGLVAYPPAVDRRPLWMAVPVQLPQHGSVGFPEPRSIGEPSAHLDNGSVLSTYQPAQSPTPGAPATPSPAGTPPAILVPPTSPPPSP